MDCCQCQGIEDIFNDKRVNRELADYRRNGARKTTLMLVEALKAEGVEGATLLDIGGGVGAVQHQLIDAGVSHAINVDASQSYLLAAKDEANRRGLAGQVSFQHGNFVDIATQVPSADLVTLDRVVCCYHDMENLVGLSAARSNRLYALVYPRDTWFVRLFFVLMNAVFRLMRSPFRSFVHPTRFVDAIIQDHGFRRRFYGQTLIWQVVVYGR